MTFARRSLLGLVLAASLAAAPAARADIWQNVLFGLTEAGFNFVGEENFLSGGADLIVSRNFTGQTLDFGATQLTLTGAPVFQFSTGGRGLETLDISLNTNNNPFNYTLVTDSGSQTTTIDGSFLLDASASINSFGWYDLTLIASSRQDIEQDGRFNNDIIENDFDIGPIRLEGNLFADLLASLTDPFFQLIGVDNIFAHFSGSAMFADQIGQLAKTLELQADAGQSLAADDVAQLLTLAEAGQTFGIDMPNLDFLDEALVDLDVEEGDPVASAVPEPSGLALLGLAGVALLRRRRNAR